MVLHAFDRMVLAVLHILRLEHLAECALALLRYQPVLAHLAPRAHAPGRFSLPFALDT